MPWQMNGWAELPRFSHQTGPPQDWYAIFPDPVIGNSILDRLGSGAVKIIVTKGKSYRKEGIKVQADMLSTMTEGLGEGL